MQISCIYRHIAQSLTLVLLTILLAACGPAVTPAASVTEVATEVALDTAVPNTPAPATDQPTTEPTSTATNLPPTETATSIPPTNTPLPIPDDVQGPVNAIILFIGDGMGVNQRLAAQWFAYGQDGSLIMDTLPVRGSQQTAAANTDVTDSAAAATALATGERTNYRYVGVDPQGENLTTILEHAQARGWSVGLVTTVQLAHATPAGFASHVTSRDYMLEIARQMLAAQVDVLLGGGEDDFLPGDQHGCYPDPGHRGDGSNLVEQAVEDGYTYVCTAEELAALDLSSVDRLLGLFGDDELDTPFQPTLTEMTLAAIEILSRNPNGFFLMVEGGQIDWAGHDNIGHENIEFTLGLDAAVSNALVYATVNPNTLLIVTGDHETGGLTLNQDNVGSFKQDGPFAMPDGSTFWVDWEIGSHTGVDIPVTALGPWSELLAGEYPNTHIFDVMYAALTGGTP